jgi:hypothetical protein
VLVGRNSLRRDLSAYPVCLLGEDYALTVAQGSEGGCHTAQSAANNDYIGAKLVCGSQGARQKQETA